MQRAFLTQTKIWWRPFGPKKQRTNKKHQTNFCPKYKKSFDNPKCIKISWFGAQTTSIESFRCDL